MKDVYVQRSNVQRRSYLLVATAINFLWIMVQLPLYWIAYAMCVVGTIRLLKYRKRYEAGIAGERMVAERLRELGGTVITNVKIPRPHTKRPRELDILYISEQGIFAIEVKRWRGEIRGSASSKHWIRVKHTKSGKRIGAKVSNPIFQARGSGKALRDYIEDLPLPNHKKFVHSIVVVVADKVNVRANNVYELGDLQRIESGKKRLAFEDIQLIANKVQQT